jgi:hypothetical protein
MGLSQDNAVDEISTARLSVWTIIFLWVLREILKMTNLTAVLIEVRIGQ